jgi:hypothetical protein
MKVIAPKEYKQTEFVPLMIELAKLFKPSVYVELGVKKCYTFNRMLPYVKKGIGIDIKDCSNFIDKREYNWEFHHCNSIEFAKKYKGPEIDLLFIDADHSCKSVLEDINTMQPFVRPWTGLVLLHDTYPVEPGLLQKGYCHDAWKAANTIWSRMDCWEIVTLPGPWAGLSILRKLVDGKHGYMDRR